METLKDKTIAYLNAHPDAPAGEVAKKCGVHLSYVHKIKQNLKKSPLANSVRGQKRDAVITYIQEHPAATIAEIAQGTGVSRTFIKDISNGRYVQRSPKILELNEAIHRAMERVVLKGEDCKKSLDQACGEVDTALAQP